MSEFRKDPITGIWRIVAEGRGTRPNEYAAPPPSPSAEADCPFCEGREALTPPEVAAVRLDRSAPNGPGWTVRAIPNRFPTVGSVSTPHPFPNSRRFERAPGTGVHEVIIESPKHSPELPYLPPEQLGTLFRFFRERVRSLTNLPGNGAVLLFENRGPESGGTLTHPHAQLVATETVPSRLEAEREGFRRHAHATRGECLFESVVAAELEATERVLSDVGAFITFAPFASEFPYEVWIVPKRHEATFAGSTDAEVDELARWLPAVLRALDVLRPQASYNWFVHGLAAPPGAGGEFHWHLEIAPRLVRADGFELGSGTSVNPVAPEDAAEELRGALGSSGS
ncbi:MAG: DUF4931 domain-containing protein [Thermoplasmata archaeon]